jgi:hypothetical protein
MSESLEQVLADLRGEAQVLQKHGDLARAGVIDAIVDRVKASAEDFITWLEEEDAILRSAHHRKWFRRMYPTWAAEGHAKKERGHYYYRQLIVPQRANLSAARQAGRDAARRSA